MTAARVPGEHCCAVCESDCDEVVELRRVNHAQAQTIEALLRACTAAAADRAYRGAVFAAANHLIRERFAEGDRAA